MDCYKNWKGWRYSSVYYTFTSTEWKTVYHIGTVYILAEFVCAGRPAGQRLSVYCRQD